MGVKVPGTKYSFWCERNIRGTNGTKREKYAEKYSGVNGPNASLLLIQLDLTHVLFQYYSLFSFPLKTLSAE